MFYTIYQITNNLNNKVYIGKHQTTDLNDGYMGSGKLLRRAIEKHGVENFTKIILFIFDNEHEMNIKEAELVDENFVLREDTYNICVGGQGGFSHINRMNLAVPQFINQEFQRQCSAKGNLSKKLKYQSPELRREYNSRISQGVRKHIAENGHSWSGRKHSEMTKQKMKKSKNVGSNNPQYGTMWITNGEQNKKITKDVDPIPEGWYKGRKSIQPVAQRESVGSGT